MSPTVSLFEPLTLRGLTFRNRIWVAPMCQYSSIDGLASDWHVQHWTSLTLSGAGLFITEATAVEARGRISWGDLGLYDDATEAAFAQALQDNPGPEGGPEIRLAREGDCIEF